MLPALERVCKAWRWPVGLCFALAVVFWLPELASPSWNIDDHGQFWMREDFLARWRWGLWLLTDGVMGGVYAPSMFGVIGLGLHALCLVPLLRLWRVAACSLPALMGAALWAVHPVFLDQFHFNSALPWYPLAHLAALTALWLLWRDDVRTSLRDAASAGLLFLLAASIWQSALPLALATLAMGAVLAPAHCRNLRRWGLTLALMGAAALLSTMIGKAVLVMRPADAFLPVSPLLTAPGDIATRAGLAAEELFVALFYGDVTLAEPFKLLLLALALAGLTLLVRARGMAQAGLSFGFILLALVASWLPALLTPDPLPPRAQTGLVAASMGFVMLPLLLAKPAKLRHALTLAALLVVAAMAVQGNAVTLRMQMLAEADMARANRLLAAIEAHPNWDAGRRDYSLSILTPAAPDPQRHGALLISAFENDWASRNIFRRLGQNFARPNDAQHAKAREAAQQPGPLVTISNNHIMLRLQK